MKKMSLSSTFHRGLGWEKAADSLRSFKGHQHNLVGGNDGGVNEFF